MFNKILVAIDGSEMSDKALKTALRFSKEKYSKVTLLHVGKKIVISQNLNPDVIEEIYETNEKEGFDILYRAKDMAEMEEVEVETIYLQGDAAAQIIQLAERDRYQLIIIGSRGLGGIKELMLGSVSHKVTQLAKCPVLIVK